MMFDYYFNKCTPFHILGGMLAGAVCPPMVCGVLWVGSVFLYQLYDGLPRTCLAWNHTKWDILETGFGVLAVGLVKWIWTLI
jgi:hypothetical protein